MVSSKSDFAQNHPEWVVKVPNREAPTIRNQWLLDLCNPDVQDFVFRVFDQTMKLSPKSIISNGMPTVIQKVLVQNGSPMMSRHTSGLIMCKGFIGFCSGSETNIHKS